MPGKSKCSIERHGDGPAIVFLHGYPLNRSLWQYQTDALKPAHQVVLVDLPGFGVAPATDRNQLKSMADIADAVEESLQLAGNVEPIVLVGLSMGGYIALEYWARYRERLRGLVLTNTKASADSAEAIETRKQTAQKAMVSGTEAAVSPMLEKLLAKPNLSMPELVTWVKQSMYSVPPQTIEMALLAMAARHDFSDRLAQIQIPALVIAGAEDEITPASGMQQMAARMPNAEFHIVPQSGHLSPLEQPQVFNHLLLDFLGKL